MGFTFARWIWVENESKIDTFGEFYDELIWTEGQADCLISCDGDYTLFVNGQYVASNQYGDFEWYKSYDKIDITSYLKEGKNSVAVLVWHFGWDSQRYLKARAGLIFEVKVQGEVLLASGERHTVVQHFPGDFSVSNATAAAAVCHLFGIELARVAGSFFEVSIKGRFETVSIGGVDYVIDYAHNGKSMRSALSVLRSYKPRKLICLFGSVGGRTQMRRAELGAAASELADFSILTADNPDTEPVENIIADIAAEYSNPDSYASINDRKKAIEYAVSIARPGDIVLLAGKGHENYQLIAGRHEPFCERDIILEAAALTV